MSHACTQLGASELTTAELTERSRWDLAAESIVVKLRWFGVVMGYILVQTRTGLHDPWAVRAFLALGAGYAALDLAFWWMGEVFLKRWPLFVSLMESVFIALLCYHDTGLEQPVPLVLSALADLLLHPLSCRRCLVDLRVSCAEPVEPRLGARESIVLGFELAPDVHDHGLGDLGELVAGRLTSRGRRRARAVERRARDGAAPTSSAAWSSGPKTCVLRRRG